MTATAFDSVVKPLSLLLLCSLPLAGCMLPRWRHDAPVSACEIRERDLTQPWSHRFYWCGPTVHPVTSAEQASAPIPAPAARSPVTTYPLHAGESADGVLTPVLPTNPPPPPPASSPMPAMVKPPLPPTRADESPPSPGRAPSTMVQPPAPGPAPRALAATLTTAAPASVVKVSFYSDGLDQAARSKVDALLPQARSASHIRLRGIAAEKTTAADNDQLAVLRAWSVRRELVHQGVEENRIRILYRDPRQLESGVEVMVYGLK